MPELPEVETTRRGVAPHITGQTITRIVVRQPRLRWPVPANLTRRLKGEMITAVGRRAKYLLLTTAKGTLILHLGMSGSLRIIDRGTPAGKHDHIDIELDNDRALRLTDPRRFGALLFSREPVEQHELIARLGPEPLSDDFTGELLYTTSRRRKLPVKQLIMDGKVVVGVGNIYASEALFLAGIDPRREAGRISMARYRRLAEAIKEVLTAAIEAGGTTLRDFVGGDGKPGYFAQSLNVYGREGERCPECGGTIKQLRLGQRSTYFCNRCQK